MPNGDLEYGAVEVQGTAAARPPRPAAPTPRSAMTIPTVKGITFDESSVTISPDGKPKVIMAVAHWCPHCQAEVPRIQEWLDENGMPADVELVAVATSNDPTPHQLPGRPRGCARRAGRCRRCSTTRSNAAASGLGVSGFPGFTVVGADGKVVFRTSGEITMAQWESLLEAARTGTAPTA